MYRKKRILHIINSFGFGGAESMLRNLLLRTDQDRFEPHVVALIDDLVTAKPIIDAGIPLVTMGMRPGVPDPRPLLRLIAHVRRLQPAVVQTWMDHSNLIGGLAALASPSSRIVWGVHHAYHIPAHTKRTTLLTVAACAYLSRHVPTRIILCSETSRDRYAKHGFTPRKLVVIPNGFDTDRFHPDPSRRCALRQELRLGCQTPLIGMAARYDAFKDHATFLRAAAILANRRPEVRFVLCGSGINSDNAALMELIRQLGIEDRCHLLGPRMDVWPVVAGLDLVVSSSIAEAFPLVLGEAMASGVPCVATDVGDSSLIIGDTGRIVKPRDPQALADACAGLLALDGAARADLCIAARRRIVERFELGVVTRQYEAVYDQILGPRFGQGPVTNGHA